MWVEKRKGLLEVTLYQNQWQSAFLWPWLALYGKVVSHMQSYLLLLASVSLREKLINASWVDKQGLVRRSLGGIRRGWGKTHAEALSLSWQE